MKIKVGQVSEKEKYEVLMLFERGLSIEELKLQLKDISYERMIKFGVSEEEKNRLMILLDNDMIASNNLYSEWWREKSQAYGWKSNNNGYWSIDFKSNEVFLELNN